MNTAQENPENENAGLSSLLTSDEPGPKDDTLAALESQVSDLEDQLHEERFLWIVGAMILFDTMSFAQAGNWAVPIVVGVLELVILVVLAERCRVNPIMPLIDRLSGFVNRTKKPE